MRFILPLVFSFCWLCVLSFIFVSCHTLALSEDAVWALLPLYFKSVLFLKSFFLWFLFFAFRAGSGMDEDNQAPPGEAAAGAPAVVAPAKQPKPPRLHLKRATFANGTKVMIAPKNEQVRKSTGVFRRY
jgi:hypothetical protein